MTTTKRKPSRTKDSHATGVRRAFCQFCERNQPTDPRGVFKRHQDVGGGGFKCRGFGQRTR